MSSRGEWEFIMLTDAQMQEFQERGFLKVGSVMTEAQADALRERMFVVNEGNSEGKAEAVRDFFNDENKSVIQIVNIWEADDLFNRHLYNPNICALVAQLMGTDTVRV